MGESRDLQPSAEHMKSGRFRAPPLSYRPEPFRRQGRPALGNKRAVAAPRTIRSLRVSSAVSESSLKASLVAAVPRSISESRLGICSSRGTAGRGLWSIPGTALWWSQIAHSVSVRLYMPVFPVWSLSLMLLYILFAIVQLTSLRSVSCLFGKLLLVHIVVYVLVVCACCIHWV